MSDTKSAIVLQNIYDVGELEEGMMLYGVVDLTSVVPAGDRDLVTQFADSEDESRIYTAIGKDSSTVPAPLISATLQSYGDIGGYVVCFQGRYTNRHDYSQEPAIELSLIEIRQLPAQILEQLTEPESDNDMTGTKFQERPTLTNSLDELLTFFDKKTEDEIYGKVVAQYPFDLSTAE